MGTQQHQQHLTIHMRTFCLAVVFITVAIGNDSLRMPLDTDFVEASERMPVSTQDDAAFMEVPARSRGSHRFQDQDLEQVPDDRFVEKRYGGHPMKELDAKMTEIEDTAMKLEKNPDIDHLATSKVRRTVLKTKKAMVDLETSTGVAKKKKKSAKIKKKGNKKGKKKGKTKKTKNEKAKEKAFKEATLKAKIKRHNEKKKKQKIKKMDSIVKGKNSKWQAQEKKKEKKKKKEEKADKAKKEKNAKQTESMVKKGKKMKADKEKKLGAKAKRGLKVEL